MKNIPQLSPEDIAGRLAAAPESYQQQFYAMYSSLWGGIVTDPRLMLIPADDHLVHRGDGVFETLKCLEGSLYNLAAHLKRLEVSTQTIGITLPCPVDEIHDIILQTARAGEHPDCLLRVLVSRGPGGYAVDPYESVAPQLYIITYAAAPAFMESHPEGARVLVSDAPVKDPFLATVKTCNYLPNVLMKKEAVDLEVDFMVCTDPQGHITEGPTENLCIVSAEGFLVRPPTDYILPGTTMARVLEMGRDLIQSGLLGGMETRPFTPAEVSRAREVLILGTTTNVTAVTSFERNPVGDGQPGPVYRALDERLQRDMRENNELRTPVFG